MDLFLWFLIAGVVLMIVLDDPTSGIDWNDYPDDEEDYPE